MKFSCAVLVVLACCAGYQVQVQAARSGERVVVPRDGTNPVIGPPVQRASDFTGNWDFFPEASGLYNGLISPRTEVIAERSGGFRITVCSDGCFSGNFAVGGDTVSIHGHFNSEGWAGISIYRWVWDYCGCFRYLVLEWNVILELVEDSDEITGTIVNEWDGGWVTQLYGLQAYYRETGITAPQAGRYTMRLPGSSDASLAPPGDGYGTLTVDSRGLVDVFGMLPDGVKFTDSVYISVDGFWPLAFSLNNGHGIVLGWIQFTVAGGMELSGDVTWIKQRNEDRKLYPNGFEGTLAATGGVYTPPANGGSPFSWTDGQFLVSEGNVTGIAANSVSFASGKFVDQGGDLSGLKFSLNKKNGSFSGSFSHPDTGKKTSFAGAVFQFEDAGGGYFQGTDVGGIVRLIGGL